MIVAQQSPTQSIALHETTIDGQKMIFIGPSILIHSTSTDAWYVYESGRCSCPGYTHRGRCKHTAPAQRLEDQDRQAATPVCSICGAVWTVRIDGVAYCGQHAPLRNRELSEEQMAKDLGLPDRGWEKRHGIARNN